MVLLCVHHPATAGAAWETAMSLARHFKKTPGLLAFVEGGTPAEPFRAELQQMADGVGDVPVRVVVRCDGFDALSEVCEELEVSFLLVQQPDGRPRALQRTLNACRGLRIPYLICGAGFAPLCPDKVLVPITFLEEEYEKAQFASAFGRFYGSQVLLLQANDYGSKAGRTVEKIRALLDKFQVACRVERARGDSYRVEREAVRRAGDEDYGLVLLSASRDYGLDDLLFGPKERHLLRRSAVPILLINPRGDLYALCD